MAMTLKESIVDALRPFAECIKGDKLVLDDTINDEDVYRRAGVTLKRVMAEWDTANPDVKRLKAELESAKQEIAQLRAKHYG